MYRYRVYGLSLHAEFPLPELSPFEASAADVTVRRGSVSVVEPASPELTSWTEARPELGDVLCAIGGVGRFSIREGREVVVDAPAEAELELLRHALLGPVLAQLLWQRGLYTLHASVLRIGARHAAFVGVSGEGKSTTALALEARGHGLLCDDIAALEWQARPVRVRPGFPRMRLHDDSLRSVGIDADGHPRVHSGLDKRLKPAREFVDETAPLDAIYLLAGAPALSADRLGLPEAMMELMKHAYNAYQLAPLLGARAHMQMAAAVAQAVPVFRLSRPRDLAALPALARFVEDHVGR